MKNCVFKNKLSQAFSIFLLFLLLIPALSFSHENGGYSHNSSISYENPSWMSRLPDDIRISEISIPGTHDSMAIHGGPIVKTQKMNLINQLNAGIRVLDIRLRHIEDVFAIHHGASFQNAFFGDVLNDVRNFLYSYPSETILISFQEEHDPKNNKMTFDEVFARYVEDNKDIVWKPDDDEENPKLSQVRGKIVFIKRFGSGTGLSIDGRKFEIQDEYTLVTNWDLYKKWEKVKNYFKKANQRKNEDTIFMNYLSGSVGSFPYFVASGHSSAGTSAPRLATGLVDWGGSSTYPDFPRVNCFLGICTIAFEGTNVLAANYLKNQPLSYVGIVMSDFPGASLIDSIINLNTLNPTVYLRSALGEKCLDANGGVVGTQPHLWSCILGHKNQKWLLGTQGRIHLENDNRKCLSVEHDSTDAGSRLEIENCDALTIGQGWGRGEDNSIRPKGNESVCIGIKNSATANASELALVKCDGGLNQKWYWFKQYRSGVASQCLDTSGNTSNGIDYHIWKCNSKNKNQFFARDSRGFLRAYTNFDKCMDPSGPSVSEGTPVQNWDCKQGYGFHIWNEYSDHTIRPLYNDNVCLDVNGGKVENGTEVILWHCHGLKNQKWY